MAATMAKVCERIKNKSFGFARVWAAGGSREFQVETTLDLPWLAPGVSPLVDVTVTGCRVGDLAEAAIVSSTRIVEFDAAAWINNTVRVMARNISPGATFDLAAVTLSVAAIKRRIP